MKIKRFMKDSRWLCIIFEPSFILDKIDWIRTERSGLLWFCITDKTFKVNTSESIWC